MKNYLWNYCIEYELPVQVNFPSLIKPLIFDDLLTGIENCKMIIVIEESPKNFGWGSEIIAYLAENRLTSGKTIVRVGADESPIPSSTLLEQKILPGKDDIINAIKSGGLI